MTSHPPWASGTGRAHGAAIVGADGHPVHADAAISNGPDACHILGLPGTGARETRDRVRAAVLNSGLPWPARTVAVNLLPASLPKHGTALDLAVAVAILTAAGTVPTAAPSRCAFIAELGLDGTLQPVTGVLPAVLAAADTGCTRTVVAPENAAEAVLVPGVAVVPCRSLRAVLAWLRPDPFPRQPDTPATGPPLSIAPAAPMISLASLTIAPAARLALEASAAGGHHLCLTGPRDGGLPALAAGLATLLPPLNPSDATQVTALYSVAGLLGSGHALITRPPYRSPHHSATRPAILGTGGSGIIRPGEAALAHHGVLHLADAPEFARDVLRALNRPLHDGEVTVARRGAAVRFPARFTLVTTMSPCPCGSRHSCSCTPLQARGYRARLTDELGSHISLRLPITQTDGIREEPAAGADATRAARIAAARNRARHRLRGTPWQLNNDIPGPELRRCYQPTAEAFAPVCRAVDLGKITERAAHQVIRVAWTLADLAGEARPGPDECGQALAFHLGAAQ
jgi:magnesium chelatase family protein